MMARVATAALVLLPAAIAEDLDRESAKLLRAAYATGTDAWVARCKERMTSKQTTCIREAKTADAVDSCWPEVDRRPPEARPVAAECDALAVHLDAISKMARKSNASSARRR
jgi:hypothetical protein